MPYSFRFRLDYSVSSFKYCFMAYFSLQAIKCPLTEFLALSISTSPPAGSPMWNVSSTVIRLYSTTPSCPSSFMRASRITVPDSFHMGDPAGGYVEMLKARNSARGHLMAWSEKHARKQYLQELTEYCLMACFSLQAIKCPLAEFLALSIST